MTLGILGGGNAVFLFKLPGEMINAGKTAAFRDGGYGEGRVSEQAFGFLDAQVQNVLLWRQTQMTNKQLAQIDLTDVQSFCNRCVCKDRGGQILPNVLYSTDQQRILNVLSGGDLVQQFVKGTEKLELILSVFQRVKAVQAGLGIAQWDHQDLFTGKACTLKVDQGKQTVLVSVKGIITPFGQNDRCFLGGHKLFAVFGVSNLSVDAQRKSIGGTVRHMKLPAFFGMDDLGRFDFGYNEIFKHFHFHHQ